MAVCLDEKRLTILKEIFQRQLDLEPQFEIEEIEQDEIDAWSSAKHLSLIMDIETTFSISFSIDEVVDMNSFTIIADAIAAKF